LNNINYDKQAASPGTQHFEVNDVLRAGFRNRGTVSDAYFYSANADEVLFRAGLSFTSVVHQPDDSAQPLTSVAPISLNWVDFTSDLNFQDPDGSSNRDSAWLYVKSTCTTAALVTISGAIRLRQLGQEDQPLIEVGLSGYAPAGANTTP
jgi:hypothetical protein